MRVAQNLLIAIAIALLVSPAFSAIVLAADKLNGGAP
jgi:hypothetical protein